MRVNGLFSTSELPRYPIYQLLREAHLSSNDKSVQWLHTVGSWLVFSAEITDLVGHAHIAEYV